MKRLLLLMFVLLSPCVIHAQTAGVAYRLRGGLFAARPTVCKATAPVDQYYASDLDIMYVCDAANHWKILAAASTSGPGTVTTTGSPASPQLAGFSSGTSITTATATEVGTTLDCADAGATDAYVCTASPVPSSLTKLSLVFTPNTSNTGAATLNANSLGVKNIKKLVGAAVSDPADNDLRAGGRYLITYDGTQWLIMSTLGNTAGASVNPTSGVVPYNNAGTFADSPITRVNSTDISTPGLITSTLNSSLVVAIAVPTQPTIGIGRNGSSGGLNLFGGGTNSDSTVPVVIQSSSIVFDSSTLLKASISNVTQPSETIASFGTPSIAGNGTLNTGSRDLAGKVTATGTGASTIVLTFSVTFTRAPACFVTNETTSNLVRPVSTTTTLTFNATIVNGDSLSYHCMGY